MQYFLIFSVSVAAFSGHTRLISKKFIKREENMRILFIGNSSTYTNNTPEMVILILWFFNKIHPHKNSGEQIVCLAKENGVVPVFFMV